MNEERKLSGRTRVTVIAVSQLSLSLPLFHSVSAGFPSPADDYTEERLNLDQYLIKNPASTLNHRHLDWVLYGIRYWK